MIHLPEKNIIIGGGPAGISIANTLNKLDQEYKIIDIGLHSPQTLNKKSYSRISTQFVGGLGGSALLWGAQNAFPTKAEIENFVNFYGAKKEYIDKLIGEIFTLADQFQIKPDVNNEYSNIFKKEIIGYPDFKTVHSIYLNNYRLINYFPKLDKEYLKKTVKKLKLQNNKVCQILFEDMTHLNIQPWQNVFIAGGTLGTTKLLIESEINRDLETKRKIKDHPSGYILTFKGKSIKNLYKGAEKLKKSVRYKRKFQFFDTQLNRKGIFEFHYDYRAKLLQLNPEKLSFLSKFKSFINIFFVKIFYWHVFSPPKTHVWMQFDQKFDENNYIEFTDEQMKICWGLTKEDSELIFRVKNEIKNFLIAHNQEIIWEVSDLDSEFEDAYHPSGSLFQTDINKKPIIGLDGKFEDVQNLYVASSATWPCAGWFNPTFFLMAHSSLIARESIQDNN